MQNIYIYIGEILPLIIGKAIDFTILFFVIKYAIIYSNKKKD